MTTGSTGETNLMNLNVNFNKTKILSLKDLSTSQVSIAQGADCTKRSGSYSISLFKFTSFCIIRGQVERVQDIRHLGNMPVPNCMCAPELGKPRFLLARFRGSDEAVSST